MLSCASAAQVCCPPGTELSHPAGNLTRPRIYAYCQGRGCIHPHNACACRNSQASSGYGRASHLMEL